MRIRRRHARTRTRTRVTLVKSMSVTSLRLARGIETLDQAPRRIGAYTDDYRHRLHSGLAYRTPSEVATRKIGEVR